MALHDKNELFERGGDVGYIKMTFEITVRMVMFEFHKLNEIN